jgi:Flp pilus assembly pilin Flp
MKEVLKRLFSDERGLETVEYAIIAGLIVVATIATVASIGGWVSTKFTQLDSGLAANP